MKQEPKINVHVYYYDNGVLIGSAAFQIAGHHQNATALVRLQQKNKNLPNIKDGIWDKDMLVLTSQERRNNSPYYQSTFI